MGQSHGQEEEWCTTACLPIEIETETVQQQQLSRWLFYVSKISSHPLVSIFTTYSLLIVLYLPRPLIPLLLSLVPISSLLLILRSRSKPNHDHLHPPIPHHPEPAELEPEPEPEPEPESKTHTEPVPALHDHFFFHSGPLRVIYEEHEGELNGDHSQTSNEIDCLRFGSFGLCFTDSDSDSDLDSNGHDQANLRSHWNVEEEEEEMIEIALEEENLIEIDISGYQR
ncbi:hypothetical protein IHE45_15G128500 [Dioscorea alata]|uniref:Uncharacterized protein n=1 Tax=Dioscorea alata TaxID=55571 RepID=A0ACB7UPI3_DIOAL|nr:hypothetical protein IHE45_15G128500 [Dioscorea alata]